MKTKLLIILVIITFIIVGCASSDVKYETKHFAMDTIVDVTAYGSDEKALRKEVASAMNKFQALANATDRFNDGGEGSVFRLNQNHSEEQFSPSPLLWHLLCYNHNKPYAQVDITLGALSDLWQKHKQLATIPSPQELQTALSFCGKSKLILNQDNKTVMRTDEAMKIDLGATAKGYGVDLIAEALRTSDVIRSALINGGGNIRVIGRKTGDSDWVIAVQHPRRADKMLGTIKLKPGQAVATSGDYQRFYVANNKRFHHLLSPINGMPVNHYQSVTVVAPTALEADYNSTLLFLSEEKFVQQYLNEHHDLGAVVVRFDGSIWVSDSLKDSWKKLSAEDL